MIMTIQLIGLTLMILDASNYLYVGIRSWILDECLHDDKK